MHILEPQTGAILILLLSALLHAAWNAAANLQKKPANDLPLILLIATLTGWLVLGLRGAVESSLLEADINGILEFRTEALLLTCGAGLFEGLYFYSLIRTFTEHKLAGSYTLMRGWAMIWVWLFSFILFNEPQTPLKFMGAACVLGAVVLAGGVVRTEGKRLWTLFWPLVAGSAIAGYHLCFGGALLYEMDPLVAFVIALSIAVPVVVRRRHLRLTPAVGVGGILCFVSYFLFLLGMQNAMPGLAITVRNSSVVFAQFFAVFLGEKLKPAHWLAALLVMLGVGLLYIQI